MCGSIGMDIGIISACIQNHIIVEYLDCEVTFLFGMGVEWLG